MKTILTSFFALSLLLILGGCEPKDPAIIKVFVRSSSNQLIDGAKVIIIGDQQSTPATLAYVDTTFTNSSGFTSFDMDPYFSVAGEANKTGYFDIILRFLLFIVCNDEAIKNCSHSYVSSLYSIK